VPAPGHQAEGSEEAAALRLEEVLERPLGVGTESDVLGQHDWGVRRIDHHAMNAAAHRIVTESGRGESNPRLELGKLTFCH
jgi:hypothetical protein